MGVNSRAKQAAQIIEAHKITNMPVRQPVAPKLKVKNHAQRVSQQNKSESKAENLQNQQVSNIKPQSKKAYDNRQNNLEQAEEHLEFKSFHEIDDDDEEEKVDAFSSVIRRRSQSHSNYGREPEMDGQNQQHPVKKSMEEKDIEPIIDLDQANIFLFRKQAEVRAVTSKIRDFGALAQPASSVVLEQQDMESLRGSQVGSRHGGDESSSEHSNDSSLLKKG